MLNEIELEKIDRKKFDFPVDCVLFDKDEFIKLKNGEKFEYNYLDYNFEYVKIFASIEILKKFIDDERVFNHFINQLRNKNNPTLSMGGIGKDFSHGGIFNITVTDMIRSIKLAIDSNIIKLNKISEARFNQYLEVTSANNLAKIYKEKTINLAIDNIPVNINVEDLILLLIDGTYFKNFFDIQSSGKSYKNLPKEDYAYALINFVRREYVLGKYTLSDESLNNLRALNTMKIIDFQSLNRLTETQDDNINNIKISSDLESFLFNNMPIYFNTLEKAIYLYIKLCQTLTYDPEFFVVNQTGKSAEKHENINNIQFVTPKNNYVVCYEFNAIYGKLLSQLGLNYDVNSETINGYGGSHASLTFRFKNFLISADSVTQILGGDLTRAKLNQPLEGLTCENTNVNTKEEFSKIVLRVYKTLLNKEKNSFMKDEIGKQSSQDYDLNELLDEYHGLPHKAFPKIPIESKLNILLDEVSKADFKEIDVLSYITQLKKIIFTEKELLFNFNVCIIRENNLIDDYYAIPTVIFIINDTNLNNTRTNKYYTYNQFSKLKCVPRSFVENMFKEGKFQYIDDKLDKYIIPGIKTEYSRMGDISKNDRRI